MLLIKLRIRQLPTHEEAPAVSNYQFCGKRGLHAGSWLANIEGRLSENEQHHHTFLLASKNGTSRTYGYCSNDYIIKSNKYIPVCNDYIIKLLVNYPIKCKIIIIYICFY